MKKIEECIVCKSGDFTPLFVKASSLGDEFTLVKCNDCGLEFLSDVPDEEEIKRYYKKEYFIKRTDRGYNNYFSKAIKNEIERIIKLNLKDLDFYTFEEKLPISKRSLTKLFESTIKDILLKLLEERTGQKGPH